MTDFERRIDAAVAGLRAYEVSAEDRAAILARDGEEAMREVVRVYSEAMRPPEDWGEGDTMRNGIDAMHPRLRERHPSNRATPQEEIGGLGHPAPRASFRKSL